MQKTNPIKFLNILNEVFRYLIVLFSAFCIFTDILFIYLLSKTDYSTYASNLFFDIGFLLIVLIFTNFKNNSMATRQTYFYLILAILNCYSFYVYITFNATLMEIVSMTVMIDSYGGGNNILFGLAQSLPYLVYTSTALSFLICFVLYFRLILIGQYNYYLSFGIGEVEKKSIVKTYNEVLASNKYLFLSLFAYLPAYLGFSVILDQISFKAQGYDINIIDLVFGIVIFVISILVLVFSRKIEDDKKKYLVFAVFFIVCFISSIVLISLYFSSNLTFEHYYIYPLLISSIIGLIFSIHIYFLSYKK